MNIRSLNQFLLCAMAAALCTVLPTVTATAADGYGTITGRFLLEGDVPKAAVQVEKGDASVKDSAVCAADTLLKNDLIIDSESKGIQNIFIYLRRAKDIHPDLKEPKTKELVFDQKGCRFTPHAMFVQVGQTVLVKSDDPIAHNTHTYPLRNNPDNFLIRPNDRDGVPIKPRVGELLPIQVKCDIHPWMLSYWLILDHPYAAVTSKDGSFKIEKLPAGKHEFRVWHERVGYVNAGEKRGFEIEVADGETTDLGTVKVPLKVFEE
ncbi:MAG: hypothetical protein KDA79_05740 [Planctomycetaceae bacterium]|nr:hypothetical protein [Planctomycetaceae bacterium]